MRFKSTRDRIDKIKMWDEEGKEHDFYEMNLSRKLDKSKKMEDFLYNYLNKLKEVVKSVYEFNSNSWYIETLNGEHFKYYSTKGKLFKRGSNELYKNIHYKSIHKFFDKPCYKVA